MTPKRSRRKRAAAEVTADLDEKDIEEICVHLRADRRKISKTLRLVRGSDLISEASMPGIVKETEFMPATYSRLQVVPKNVLMAAIEAMDGRFPASNVQHLEKANKGTVWKLFSFMTGAQRHWALPGHMRCKKVFIEVWQVWSDHLGLKRGLPPMSANSGYELAIFKFSPEAGPGIPTNIGSCKSGLFRFLATQDLGTLPERRGIKIYSQIQREPTPAN